MDRAELEHPSTTIILNKYKQRQREIGEKPKTLLLVSYTDGKHEYFGICSLEHVFYALETIERNYHIIDRIDYLQGGSFTQSYTTPQTNKAKIINKNSILVLSLGNGEALYMPLRTTKEGRQALELLSFELDQTEYIFIAEKG